MLCRVFSAPSADIGTFQVKNKISGKRERISYESYRNERDSHRAAYSPKI